MATSDKPENLTVATVNGVKWTMTATIVNSVLQVGYTGVMARLLSPAAFGLVALAGVILRFGVYFAKMGMERAIIQKPDLTERDVRAAFTSSVLLGAFFAGLLMAGAPLAASIVHQPEVIPVVRALALGIFMSGLNGTAMSLLHRAMRFRALALFEMASFLLSYLGLGLLLAWQGFGVWALVAATLGQGLIMTILAYGAVRHTLRPLFSWEAYRPLLAYGSRMSAISFVEFVTMSLDTLLIGRLLGPAALGIYTRGGLLIGLPVYLLSSNIAKVVFPSFSQVQANRARLREVYLSSITLVAMLVTPVCAGAAVAAPEIVRVMLGEKWLAAVPILQVISITYVLSAVTMFAGVVCDATAALSRKLLLTLVCLGALAALLYVGSRFGLVGVAWAMVGCELLRTALYSNIMRRELGAAPFAVLRAYGPGVLAGAGVAGVIAVVRFALLALHAPALAVLVAEMLAGAVVLGALVLVRPPVQLRNVLRPLLARLGGDGTGPVPAGLLPRLLHALAARFERLAEAPAVVAPPTPVLALELEADTPAEPLRVPHSATQTELV